MTIMAEPTSIVLTQPGTTITEYRVELQTKESGRKKIKIQTKEVDADDKSSEPDPWVTVYMAEYDQIISLYRACNRNKNCSILHMTFKHGEATHQYEYNWLTLETSAKVIKFLMPHS